MKHLDRDLLRLQDHMVALGKLVEEATTKSVRCVETYDLVLVEEILEGEQLINDREVEIEEECLKVLALHQPVAIDLRFLIVVLKVNNDLERMADQAVNIAERVKFLSGLERLVIDLDFPGMGKICSKMVHRSIDALVRRDVATARKVLEMDDELDAMHARSYGVIQEAMQASPDSVPQAVSHLTISSNMERLGDLATNIAEEIIFMEEGEVIRHRT